MAHSFIVLLFIALVFPLLQAPAVLASEMIRIGVSLGLSGSYSLTSARQKNAYLLFEQDINRAGGILGRQVEFVILDNGSDKDIAIAQYTQLITKEQVDFVIGPYTSKLTLAISPVVEKFGYPTLVAGAAADRIWQQGYENVFGMWTPASRYVLGFLKLLAYHRVDRIVIVTGDGPFARGLAEGARKWAGALRLEVVDYITFPEGIDDFTPVAEKVKNLEPEVLICTGHYYVGVGMKKALATIGWQPDLFYATVSPTFDKYSKDLGDAAENDFSTAIWEPHPKLKYPGSYDFARSYQEKFNQPPTYHAASAYASGEVLARAITEAGTVDRGKVRQVLQQMTTTSVLGRYSVDKTGMQIKRFPLIVQWQHGQKEVVWPLELQTRPAVMKVP